MKKFNIPIGIPNITASPPAPTEPAYLSIYSKNNQLYQKDSNNNELKIVNKSNLDEIYNVTREPTGFYVEADPKLQTIDAYYDTETKRITLTGTFKAYFRGNLVLNIVDDSWTSEPCPNVVGEKRYMLCYDKNGWDWKTYGACHFSHLIVAYLYFRENGDFVFAIRETHGFMNWEDHSKWHNTLGTTLVSGGDIEDFIPNSTTPINRRPDITTTIVEDEDLRTVLPGLTTKSYTRAWLSGDAATSLIEQDDIVPLNGNIPRYNTKVGDDWVLQNMDNNRFMSVWVYAKPTTSDTQSQNYRYVFLTGQSQSSTITTQRNLATFNLEFADLLDILPEVVFIGQIIISYSGNNWRIEEVRKITGSQMFQVTQIGGGGAGLTTVTSNNTLNGSGTIADPLGVNETLFVNTAGDTMTGKLTLAASTTTAKFRIPHGSTPTTFENGDVWSTTSGLFARINGTTRDLMFKNSQIVLQTNTTTASESNVGTMRYRKSGDNTYIDVVMQTGEETYEWVNILQNNW